MGPARFHCAKKRGANDRIELPFFLLIKTVFPLHQFAVHRVGFEPTRAFRTLDLKSSSLDHSDIDATLIAGIEPATSRLTVVRSTTKLNERCFQRDLNP